MRPFCRRVRRLITLPYDRFDQTDGFRPLALKHCELVAAMLLDSYVVNAANRMTELNRQALHFHAGQLYAYSGLGEVAATRFLQSLNPHQNSEDDLDWNDYVLASAAFEKNDRPGLVRAREALMSAKKSEGNGVNLRVVDGLIGCFSKPYVVAYETCRPHPDGDASH